jgi:hypothetical protein
MVPQSDHFLSLLFRMRLSLVHVNRASALMLAIMLLLTLTKEHTMANMERRIQEQSLHEQGPVSLKSAIE